MGERKDLRDLLKDTDFTQKRIIDDLATSDAEADYSERGMAGDMRRSEGGDFIKNIFVGLLLVGIVVGSFWISFLIGKKVLVPPIKNLPTFEMPAPKTITKAELEGATPVKEEFALQEKEIKAIGLKTKLLQPVAAKKALSIKEAGKTVAVRPEIKIPVAKTKGAKFYKVITGTYKTAGEANELTRSLKEKGFQSYVKKISGLFRVQAGAFDKKEKAAPLVVKLKDKGFTPTIIIE